MIKYLDEIFGIKAEIKEWEGKRKLPIYLRSKREYYVLSMEEKSNLLLKTSSENFNMTAFQSQIQQLKQYTNLSVILWFESISTYQRQALIKNRIPFIIPNSQIYVPEWGACLKERYSDFKIKQEKLTAMGQYLLLYLIYQNEIVKSSQSELAVKTNMSAMKVSRAVQELVQLGLVTVQNDGNRKIVKTVARGKELYTLAEDYFKSPIQKKIFVDYDEEYLELPLAGEDALANRSMLNPPKHRVVALEKKKADRIPSERKVDPKWISDSNYIEIELWRYDPSMFVKEGMVDVISLLYSLDGVDDERVEMQMEEMMEEYKW